MKYRHEFKFQLSPNDYLTVRARLRAVLLHDSHVGENNEYHIRSIYFDTPGDKALREKIDGVNSREKFRIRFYNGDLTHINLEKKSKLNGLSHKQTTAVSQEEAALLLEGIYPDLAPQRTLLAELISKMQYQQLRPKTIVDYIREPFIFTAGNVRVTLDRGIRTGTVNGVQALTSLAVTIPAGTQGPLLEVKYDEFLPEIIRDIVQLGSRQAGAFPNMPHAVSTGNRKLY